MAHKTKEGRIKRGGGKSGDRKMASIGFVCLGLSLDKHWHNPNRFRLQLK
jgi:hypothetical protein